MKIEKSKKINRYILTVLALIITLFVALMLYYVQDQTKDKQPAVTASASQKSTVVKGPEANSHKKTGTSSDQPIVPEKPTGSSKATISVLITSSSQTGNKLSITTLIELLSSSGECTLSVEGVPSLTQTVGVQPLSASSTCKGFDVDTSSLKPGLHTLTLLFNNENYTGTTTQEIEIK
jgi:hypothetical protein